MKTGDLSFTTVIRTLDGADWNGYRITESALKEAIANLEGKTLVLTDGFGGLAIGKADRFEEIEGVGFTIGGTIASELIRDSETGHLIIDKFDLTMVSIVPDQNKDESTDA